MADILTDNLQLTKISRRKGWGEAMNNNLDRLGQLFCADNDGNFWLVRNAVYDHGTGIWLQEDDTKPSTAVMLATNGTVKMKVCASGTTPFTWSDANISADTVYAILAGDVDFTGISSDFSFKNRAVKDISALTTASAKLGGMRFLQDAGITLATTPDNTSNSKSGPGIVELFEIDLTGPLFDPIDSLSKFTISWDQLVAYSTTTQRTSIWVKYDDGSYTRMYLAASGDSGYKTLTIVTPTPKPDKVYISGGYSPDIDGAWGGNNFGYQNFKVSASMGLLTITPK